MFGLFKHQTPAVKVIDRIWMTETAKFQSLVREWEKNNQIICICWFDDTLRHAASFFTKETSGDTPLITAREITSSHVRYKQILFAEHHPLQQKENELFQKLNIQQAIVWSALDEPLFRHFGGDKILHLMQHLGMKENEAIEHTMISKAIQKAQEKINKKVIARQGASSQEEWLRKNLQS